MTKNAVFVPTSISVSTADVARCRSVMASARGFRIDATKSVVFRAALSAFAALSEERQAELLRNEIALRSSNV